MTKQFIDWKTISGELNRVPARVKAKWRYGMVPGVGETQNTTDIHSAIVTHSTREKRRLPHATFGRSEDALIVQREVEWGDRGPGLWAALEKEIGRSSRDIHRRRNEIMEEDA